ncbi:MAG: hypothetical protein ACSHYA_15070 [Opitutaceae bacterium]
MLPLATFNLKGLKPIKDGHLERYLGTRTVSQTMDSNEIVRDERLLVDFEYINGRPNGTDCSESVELAVIRLSRFLGLEECK